MQYTGVEFVKHLNSVCKDKELAQYAIRMYNDLVTFYYGEKFTKDCFETIEIDGKIYNQDIVNELFKDGRQYVTIDQIFTYQFIHFVKSFSFVPAGTNVDWAGCYSFFDKYIKILNEPDPEGKARTFSRDRIRRCVYHELIHCLTTRSYWQGALSALYSKPEILYNKDGQCYRYWKNIPGARMQPINVKGYACSISEDQSNYALFEFRNKGMIRYMESLTDLLTRQIFWHDYDIFYEGFFNADNSGEWAKRKESYSSFSYTDAFDVTYPYYIVAANSQTFHLNDCQIADILKPERVSRIFNSYTISEDTTERVFDNLQLLIMESKDKAISGLDIELLKKLDTMSLIYTLEGIAIKLEKEQQPDQAPANYKILIQALIFDAAQNNIVNENRLFSVNNINEQTKLIEKYDKMLTRMYDFLILPKQGYDWSILAEEFRPNRNKTKEEILSPDFVFDERAFPHFAAFSELMIEMDNICLRFKKENPYIKLNAPFWEKTIKNMKELELYQQQQRYWRSLPAVQLDIPCKDKNAPPIIFVPYHTEDIKDDWDWDKEF